MASHDFHFRNRPAYTSETLQQALARGLTPTGARLSSLMPRYELSTQEVAGLRDYLSTLSALPSPGAEGSLVHFATVTTPEARRTDMETTASVLKTCFNERYPAGRRNGMRWELHEWSLQGSADTWPAQLRALNSTRPVFALVSGTAGSNWKPVHQFCADQGIPCLFPNVDIPASATAEHFNFYFSAGPLLEAAVLRQWLGSPAGATQGRLLQAYQSGNAVGEAGAQAFATALDGPAGAPAIHPLGSDLDADARVLQALRPGDTLVLWLDSLEFSALVARVATPPDGVRIYASGWMLDRSSWTPPQAWRRTLALTYPFDPPRRRKLRMQFNLQPWLARHDLDPVEATIAGNTLATCNLLTEAMASVQGTLTRQKLVEQIENYPWTMGNAPATQAFQPFSLATGQRFGAKGAYIVRYREQPEPELEPVSELLVP